MAPLYDPATERPEDAKACIDRFGLPNIPCTYPVVWVRAREAAEHSQRRPEPHGHAQEAVVGAECQVVGRDADGDVDAAACGQAVQSSRAEGGSGIAAGCP